MRRTVHLASVRAALLTVTVQVLLTGCGLLGGLDGRAAGYYNYMVGRFPGRAYSSYLSPAYKEQLGREGVRTLDESRRQASKPNTRYPEARAGDVLITRQDRFAWSVVNPALGDAFAVLQPQRWVRVGTSWYLYGGSQAEIENYGNFPSDLAPPPLAEFTTRDQKSESAEAPSDADSANAKPSASADDQESAPATDGSDGT